MKIDEFTKDEQTFLLGNVSQMNVPLAHPEAEKISALGRSVITKLENSLGVTKEPAEKKPLASAARPKPRSSKKR